MVVIDSCVLIREVKKRSCLYKKEYPKNLDNVYKWKIWEDVAAKVLENDWDDWDKTKRKRKVKAVIKRWKILRAGFTRELKRQIYLQLKGINANGRKPRYCYFEELLFLKSETGMQNIGNDSPLEPIDRSDLPNEEVMLETEIEERFPKTKPKIIQVSEKLKELIASGNEQDNEDIMSLDKTSNWNEVPSSCANNLEKEPIASGNEHSNEDMISTVTTSDGIEVPNLYATKLEQELIGFGNKQSDEDMPFVDTTSTEKDFLKLLNTSASYLENTITSNKHIIERNRLNISSVSKENRSRIISNIEICNAVSEKSIEMECEIKKTSNWNEVPSSCANNLEKEPIASGNEHSNEDMISTVTTSDGIEVPNLYATKLEQELIGFGNKQSDEDMPFVEKTSTENDFLKLLNTSASYLDNTITSNKHIIERNRVNISSVSKENSSRIISNIEISNAVSEKSSEMECEIKRSNLIRDSFIDTENKVSSSVDSQNANVSTPKMPSVVQAFEILINSFKTYLNDIEVVCPEPSLSPRQENNINRMLELTRMIKPEMENNTIVQEK